MAQLVTGVYYEPRDAERAVTALRQSGIPAEEIYLETEVSAGPEAGWKGGEIGHLEKERRIAGIETELLMGVTLRAPATCTSRSAAAPEDSCGVRVRSTA